MRSHKNKKRPSADSSIARLASAVRKRRKSLGLTQAQLGQFAGCGALFIHELELGKATVRFNKLLDVLKVLGLELHLHEGKTGLSVQGKLL